MKILLAVVAPRRSTGPAADLIQLYIERTQRFSPCACTVFRTESALLEAVFVSTTRSKPALLLADSRGDQLTSEDLATTIGAFQDDGTQNLTLAIGPADGWSPSTLPRADRTIAFGRITLPHELAAVVAAEQIYRALTIRAGHPYHSGH